MMFFAVLRTSFSEGVVTASATCGAILFSTAFCSATSTVLFSATGVIAAASFGSTFCSVAFSVLWFQLMY
jgi:hypothetical protein